MGSNNADALERTSYEDEVKECDNIYKGICYNIDRTEEYIVTHDFLEKAYSKAKKLHGDTRRLSGELYLKHPLAVMRELSTLFCNTNLLAAALLHDTIEDCNCSEEELRGEFGGTVSSIVKAVSHNKEEDKEAILKLLSSPFQREALLVRLADRAHNLSTLESCEIQKQRKKIADTRANLIPITQALGIRYYDVILNDYCMQYDAHGTRVSTREIILKKRRDLLISCEEDTHVFDELLRQAIRDQKDFSFPRFNPFAKQIRTKIGLDGDNRNSYKIFPQMRRLLTAYEISEQVVDPLNFERSTTILSEIILTCSNKKKSARSKASMLAAFIDFHKTYLKPHHILMEIDHEHETNISIAIILTDSHENNYRVVLIPDSYLEEYFIGDPNGAKLTVSDTSSLMDITSQKMTIYTSYLRYDADRDTLSPASKRRDDVPIGSTALDFAFLCSSDMALTVTGVKIHSKYDSETDDYRNIDFSGEDEYIFPLETILRDGDIVHFETDRDLKDRSKRTNHACLDWFAFLNTAHARQCLINYLKTKV